MTTSESWKDSKTEKKTIMKALHKIGTTLGLAGSLLLATSCTDHFEDLNTNPNAAASADPAYVL
ncbi:MAG TPA: hypothetical protein DCP28_09100, partial [Cytophagales bacterium]|nr:hypothetical protein [Cytophagales bacterium]